MNPPLDESPTLNDSDSETDETFPKTIDSCVIQPNANTDIAVNESHREALSAPASQTLSSGQQQQQQAADQLTSYVDAVNQDEPFSVVPPKRQHKQKASSSGQRAASNPLCGRRTNSTHRASHEYVVIGSGTQTRSLKAAKHNSSTSNSDGIFVSRLRAGTTFNDMRDHLFHHAGLRLKYVPICSRNDHLYASFRIVCNADHFPLAMSFELLTSELSGPEPVRSTTIRANTASLERATKSDIKAYHRRCLPLLSSIAIPHVALLWSDAQCDNISHREAISKLYRDITNAMLTSSAASIQTKTSTKTQTGAWVERVCKETPCSSETFIYHRNEAQIKADKLAESFLPLDNTAFWKEVQTQSLRSTPLVASVNGTSGEDAIANMWAKHYGEILNASDTDTSQKQVIKELHAAYENAVSEGSLNNSLFIPREVEKSISKMKRGKAAANDGLCAEHLIYAPSQIHVLLMVSFNLSLTHNYLPPFVTESTSIPILKDKSGNGWDIGNYRPIALSSAITKVLES
ncbi:hypothetical protein CAPTEDRAFT_201559 [Capitella teleta]|uniref:Uncharacterized protein n=1 Tax=Capitella teleta TaxID=283909 RepID=R7UG15_CAPTE|nr:hypothetical protein CAPTEDRAFT_201559 [Capitella teleta]|eukprot:ELU02743.1 hypothetical protein CAPTEDRAFT_201559 [Capitella teleta]